MSNAYFRFKQFTVQHDRCGMKVSTDACIQGAWTPVGSRMKRVLDVGAGTGLLSLMLAQRLPLATIDAIEIEADAASQAAENAAASPFAARINVVQADASSYISEDSHDLLICNPPFFKNSLQGPDDTRNAARHAERLNQDSLIRIALQALSPGGAASFLWPAEAHESFAAKGAKAGLYLQRQLNIRHRAGSLVTRVVGIYSRIPAENVAIETLTIRNDAEEYTYSFISMLSPFYLHL